MDGRARRTMEHLQNGEGKRISDDERHRTDPEI
jgi:hypothetical protein